MKELGQNLVSIPENTILFRENDFSKDVYILKTGKIHLYRRMGNKIVMLSEVEPGGILGEISVIDSGPRSATAVAVKPCTAIKITPSEFMEGLRNVPEWFMSIARILAQRLRETDKKLNLSGPLVNEANMAAILMYLFHDASNREQGLSLQEVEDTLMELLHLQINEIQEVFDSLEKKKLLSFKQNKVRVEDVKALEAHLEKIRMTFSTSLVV
ncbi:MAG: hypothetical protein A2293_10965 [Elusimicrobia bacterium RIFOXYB2_FULL_49_7]|nr:MAG: hypothetical protein A2293_10965 [Elusimicrobia bacterium RIFOXYB2_FULL_49_7]